MSWLGYKAKASTSQDSGPSEEQLRETKRQKLQEERLLRAKQRADHKRQLQSIIQSRKEAEEVLQGLLDIDPNIFEGDSTHVSDEEIEAILANPGEVEDIPASVDEPTATMVDFDAENGTDGEKAQDQARAIKVEFEPSDIKF